MRDKLIELIQSAVNGCSSYWAGLIADCLLAHGVTVQEWIPVSERLPEDSGFYLVHHKGGFVSERYFYEDAPEIFAQVQNYPVTHWMPLPAAPKEVE